MNRKNRPRPGPRKSRSESRKSGNQGLWIYGHHPVLAAVANPARRCRLLLATADALKNLQKEADLPGDLTVKTAERQEIERQLGPGSVHQGLALQADPLPDEDLQSACSGHDLVLVLDQVTDPHNIGAILRSAAAFGAAAVVLQDRHSPAATGALTKAASGAVEKVPMVRVVNLARALDELKTMGFWIVGLDAEAPASLDHVAESGPIALVLGAEGPGLRRLSREACDVLAQIPFTGGMSSLNVSNAAAVALYALRSALERTQSSG